MKRTRIIMFFALLLLLTTLAPAVTAQQSASGYFYYADGQVVNLQVSGDFIAVRTNPGTRLSSITGIRSLSGVGNVSNTIEIDSPRVTLVPLAAGSNGVTVTNNVRTMAASSIEWAMPVFQISDIYHVVTDRFLASFPLTMTDAQVDAYNANYGVVRLEHLTNNMDNIYVLAVTSASGRNAIEMANLYQSGGVARYATPEFMRLEQTASPRRGTLSVPNDTYSPSQWHLNNTAQFTGTTSDADIDGFEAWDLQMGSSSIKIAILDSGVEITHPDLSSKIVNPYDPVEEDSNPSPNPGVIAEWWFDGHGTLVAGLAGASTNNSAGVSGVCPNCSIMPIRIARTIESPVYGLYSQFLDSNIIQGFDWARTQGAAVLNNSWGGGYANTGITNAISNAVNYGRYQPLTQIYLGSVVVFAAGNDYNEPVIYPAVLSNVMAVGATNLCDQHKSPINNACDGNEVWGSNVGPEMDIAAPGVRLYSTDLTGDGGENYTCTVGVNCTSAYDYYSRMNGTSGASPIVSGVAGLVLSENPNLTQLEVQNILMASADDIVLGSYTNVGFDWASGWGRVNAWQALQLTEYLMIAPTAPASPSVPERPIFTWTDYLPANWYYIEVRNANTNAVVATQYLSITQANCAGTCTGQISTALPAGTYKYRLIPFIAETNRSAGSFTPFSANFTIGSPTITAPTGTVNSVGGNPTYSWTGLTGATHYYILVVNAAGTIVVNEVIDAAGNCTGLDCNVDPTLFRESARLSNGTYRFWIRSWLQNGGTGALSAMGTFTLSATPPSAPITYTPTGLTTLRPGFDWDAPAGSTFMHLYVIPASGGAAVIDRWISRTEACGSPTGTVCHANALANLVDGASYKYFVQVYGPGGVSGWSTERLFTVNAPSPAIPSGMTLTRLTNGFVKAQWNDDPNTLWFGLMINNAAGTAIHSQWYQRTGELCNGVTCETILTANFTGGTNYRMYMMNFGDGGVTAWTLSTPDPALNDSPAAPLAVTTFASPLGPITTDRPTYQWTSVNNASWYYLWTSTGQGTGWYSAQTICVGVTCTVTPAASIGNGAFTWYVSSFGPGGMAPTSATQNFNLGIGTVPVMPTGVNVTGTNTPNPSISWNRDTVNNATLYRVSIGSTTASVVNAWYHVSQICDPTTCTLNLNTAPLANGGYYLYIQGYNPAGLGPWTANNPFTVNVPAPDVPTLVTPTNGAILLTNRPTFTWNSVANASFYNIELINSLGVVTLTQWISTPTICAATCTFTPTTVVPYGIYTWRVRGYSQGGVGNFSTVNLFYALSMSTTPQMVQSNDGVLRNPGNWSAVQDANALGGSYASNAAGTSDAMMMVFEGTGIDIVYMGGASYGSFIVEIDGYAYQTVNSSYASTRYGLAVQIQGLAAGQHTLRIIPVNGSSVAIDAFYVAGAVIGGGDVRPTPVPTENPTEAPTTAPTVEPTAVPTEAPTEIPTEVPTEVPTEAPTEAPTEVPIEAPTETPVP